MHAPHWIYEIDRSPIHESLDTRISPFALETSAGCRAVIREACVHYSVVQAHSQVVALLAVQFTYPNIALTDWDWKDNKKFAWWLTGITETSRSGTWL